MALVFCSPLVSDMLGTSYFKLSVWASPVGNAGCPLEAHSSKKLQCGRSKPGGSVGSAQGRSEEAHNYSIN